VCDGGQPPTNSIVPKKLSRTTAYLVYAFAANPLVLSYQERHTGVCVWVGVMWVSLVISGETHTYILYTTFCFFFYNACVRASRSNWRSLVRWRIPTLTPAGRLCKRHLASKNAQTLRWWRLLTVGSKMTRLQQFSGQSRLHLPSSWLIKSLLSQSSRARPRCLWTPWENDLRCVRQPPERQNPREGELLQA